VDHGKPLLGFILLSLGTFVVLAPVPMTVVRPDTFPEGGDDLLSVNE